MSAPRAPTSPCKGEHRRPTAAVLVQVRRCEASAMREAGGRGSAVRFSRTLEVTDRARRLRKNSTDVERKLWYRLRRDQLNGLSFRRQHPVGPYILDFYCASLRFAVELDGGQHNSEPQRRKDDRRTRWLESNGIKVLRFWNNDVTGNLLGVLEEIARVASELTPSPTLPLSGGGGGETAPRSRKSGGEHDPALGIATAPRAPTSPCKVEVARKAGGRGSPSRFFQDAGRRES